MTEATVISLDHPESGSKVEGGRPQPVDGDAVRKVLNDESGTPGDRLERLHDLRDEVAARMRAGGADATEVLTRIDDAIGELIHFDGDIRVA